MKTKKLVFLSLLVAYSLVMYIIETMIPNPLIAVFPGAKLGLSNIVTLLCLLFLNFKESFAVLTLRMILSSIFTGPLSYLLFSVGGGYLSLAVMYVVLKIKGISEVGVSVCGAIAHNMGQLLVAALIINNLLITGYLPFMIITSVITGVFVGLCVKFSKKPVEIQMKKYLNI